MLQLQDRDDLEQILVQPEKGPLQVTFDNNKRSNYWSYHSGCTDKIHITGKYNDEK